MIEKKIKHNNNCDLWRVVATFMIAILHLNIRYNGQLISWYIAVEFFFMISGFWLAEGIMSGRYDEKSTWSYTWGKICKFYPHIIFSFLIYYFFMMFNSQCSIGGILSIPYGHLNEIVPFMYPFSIKELFGNNYMFQTWYVNVLVTVCVPIFYLLKHHTRFFKNFFAPVIIIMSYLYIFNNCTSFNAGDEIFGGASNLTYVRGIAAVCLGSMGFFVTQELKKIQLTDLAYKTAHVIEYTTFIFVIIASYVRGNSKLDWSYVMVMFVTVILMTLYRKDEYVLSNSRVIVFLSDISYAMFLNHIFVITIFHIFVAKWTIYTLLLYLGVLIFYSAFTNLFVKKLVSLGKQIFIKLYIQKI